jgi:Peptidase M1 N-terminal domain
MPYFAPGWSRRSIALGVPAAAQANVAAERSGPRCEPGAPGLGDTYYPTYGNGGYDVRHYDLDVTYDPATDVLDGLAAIKAKATQSLCSFNLDLVGMTVREVEIDGSPAQWTRSGQELVITPKHPLQRGRSFEVQVRYDGIPHEFVIVVPGFELRTGFMATPDGATVAGQPEVAAGWFPVNDHPLDKAAYSFDVTVPTGYEVVANGFLKDTNTRGGMTTYEWDAREPMGVLPRHHRHRPVGRRHLAHRERPPRLRCCRLGDYRRAARSHRLLPLPAG